MLQSWVGWGHADESARSSNYVIGLACSKAYIALGSTRAKVQLLPALRVLAGQKNTWSATATTAPTTHAGHASSAPPGTPVLTTKPSQPSFPARENENAPPTAKDADFAAGDENVSTAPSLDRIESLLGLLEGENNPSEMTGRMPSLRMAFPTPGGRISGGVVYFQGELNLGSILTAQLMAGRDTSSSRSAEGIAADSPRFDDGTYRSRMGRGGGGSGGGDGSFGGMKEAQHTLPDIERCVIRVVVDGVVASTLPVDQAFSAAAVQDNSDNGLVVDINTLFVPAYEKRKRCAEHPAKAATAAVTGGGGWVGDEDAWRLESRAIDKICTRELFGAHYIHGELACRRALSGRDDIEQDSS